MAAATMFKVTLIAPRSHGTDAAGSASVVLGASDLADHLRQLGLNWHQSDQWHEGRVIIIVEPERPAANALIRELQDKLDSIRVVVEVDD